MSTVKRIRQNTCTDLQSTRAISASESNRSPQGLNYVIQKSKKKLRTAVREHGGCRHRRRSRIETYFSFISFFYVNCTKSVIQMARLDIAVSMLN